MNMYRNYLMVFCLFALGISPAAAFNGKVIKATDKQVILFDIDAGKTLTFTASPGSKCASRENSYPYMARALRVNGSKPVDYWLAAECGPIVKLCANNVRGEQTCAIYRQRGWRPGN